MRRLGALLLAIAGAGCPAFHEGPLPGAPAAARYAEPAGIRLRYTDTGAGPAVVLIHGFASSLETWERVAPALARTHRVIALDLPGFGWSARPEGDYSPPALARQVLALLDDRGVRQADVVGHSWGASIALALARAAPERVGRLALYDAFVYEDQVPALGVWARAPGVGEALFALFYAERADEKLALAFHDPRFLTERLVEDVERALDRPGTTAAALAAMRGMRFAEAEAGYRAVDRPVLLLWGREDRVTPVDVGERLARELPRARLVVYPRCGHFPMIEAAPASTAELEAFLR